MKPSVTALTQSSLVSSEGTEILGSTPYGPVVDEVPSCILLQLFCKGFISRDCEELEYCGG